MKMTVDAGMMKEMFKNWNRDYYTYEGCETLLEFYDEIDENIEFDVIAICCDWNEYGETPCLKWKDFISDYGYLLEDEETAEMTDDEKINTIIEKLEDKTTVIKLSNSVLIEVF